MHEGLIVGHWYKHYKGGEYFVRGVATHTETHEKLVVYCRVGDPDVNYARPLSMWFDEVGVDENGQPITRFTRCGR